MAKFKNNRSKQQGRKSGPVGVNSTQVIGSCVVETGTHLNFGRLNCGGTPMRVLMTHCCAMTFVWMYVW